MTGSDRNQRMGLDEAISWGLHQFTCWGVLATDARLIVTGWNRWLENQSGRPAGEVVGRNLLEVFPELVSRRFDRFYRQALTGQVVLLSQRFHKYLIRMPPAEADSPLPEMRQSVHIAPLAEGEEVVGTLTLIEDVTQRVAYEEELGASARHQAALALLSQRALSGGELSALMNKAATVAAETLGVEVGEISEFHPGGAASVVITTRDWSDGSAAGKTHPADASSLAALVLQSSEPVVLNNLTQETRFKAARLRERGVVSGAVVKIVRRGGVFGMLAVYAMSQRAFNADHLQFLQAIANVLGMAIERKDLETALRGQVEALAAADRRKDEFLAMLGHELRNPLAPIRHATGVLQRKAPPDPDLVWARDVIDRQVQQMTRLVDDLLDVSRITRGKVNFHKEPVELAAVVARAVETCRPILDTRKHQFSVSLPAEPLRLEADAARLAQILGNLLNNAAKYTPAGGRVELTATREGGDIVIRVRDTGVGIPAEMLPSIFDLFMQVDRSLDRSEGGLGIGLTLVRSLVALHGGRVAAFSDGPGQGSEFVVHLPALPAEAVSNEGDSVDCPVPGQAVPSRRILVVDDNQDSAESLAMLLRIYGHTVRTAYDGPAALNVAHDFSPDVVLLDIGLPGFSGMEVVRRIRSDPGFRDALVVAMTGYGQDEDRQRSQAAGFNAHLVKPVDLDRLQSLLVQYGNR
jgi:signal transduction histidine kinase